MSRTEYRTFNITAEYLQSVGACLDGQDFFNKYFPDGVTISNCQEEMDELVAELWCTQQDNHGPDHEAVVFVNWFCYKVGGRTGYRIAGDNTHYVYELSWCGVALSDLPLFKD